MATQLPAELAPSHAWQEPSHFVSQQTPSTQKLDEHWLLVEQAAPLASLAAHAPPLQKLPVPQSPSTVQDVAQPAPLAAQR